MMKTGTLRFSLGLHFLVFWAQFASGEYSGNAHNTQRQVFSPVIRAHVDAAEPLLSETQGGPQNFSCNVKVKIHQLSSTAQNVTVTLIPNYMKMGFEIGLGCDPAPFGTGSKIALPSWPGAGLAPSPPAPTCYGGAVSFATVPPPTNPPTPIPPVSWDIPVPAGATNWNEVEFTLGCVVNQSSTGVCLWYGFNPYQQSDTYWTGSGKLGRGTISGPKGQINGTNLHWVGGSENISPSGNGSYMAVPTGSINGNIPFLSGEASFTITVGANTLQGAVLGTVYTHCSVLWGEAGSYEVVTPLAGGHAF